MSESGGAGEMTRMRTLMSSWRARLAAAGVLLIAVGLGVGLSRYELHTVGTSVMNPAIAPGDRVVVDRTGLGRVPQRGDIVVTDGGWGSTAVSLTVRVVGLPGDHLVCDQAGTLTVNGALANEPYAHGDNATFGAFDVMVPQGRYFVLGDARNVSVDSRSHLTEAEGTLAPAQIQGRVVGAVQPVLNARLIGRTSLVAVVVAVLLLAGAALLVPAVWAGIGRLFSTLRAGLEATRAKARRRRPSEAD